MAALSKRRLAGLVGLSVVLILLVVVVLPENPAAQAELLQSRLPRAEAPASSSPDLATLAHDNEAFALALYQQLRGSPGNLLFAPHSLSAAFVQAYSGARGQTAEQMAAALHLSLPPERLHPAFNALDRALARNPATPASEVERPGFQLTSANALWAQRGYAIRPAFLDLLAQQYGAGLRVVDFEQAPEPARQEINRWVSDQTRGTIDELLGEDSINEEVRLVLANALTFSGLWGSPFAEAETASAPFWLLDGTQVSVPTMHQFEKFQYAEGEGYQVVGLHYEGGAEMVILLPDSGELEAFEAGLSPQRLEELLAAREPREVRLALPSFRYSADLTSLKEALMGLGMRDAFEPKRADFSGINEPHEDDLYISHVAHQATIAVDERGTEATAATGLVFKVVSGSLAPPATMTVDRPFIFLIRDHQTGAVLFMGRVVDPRAS